MKGKKAPEDRAKVIAKLQGEIGNLTDAIASGALRALPALAERLDTAERELSRQEAASTKPRGTVEQIFPRMEAEYRELVAGIERVLTTGDDGTNDPRLVARSRAALQVRYGEIRVEVTPDALEFRSTQGIEAALARVAGGDSQIMLVAGVGFGFSCRC